MIQLTLLLLAFDYGGSAQIGLGYDDNVFAYSPYYLEMFLSGNEPQRFPIETYDDVYTELDVSVLLRWHLLGKRTTTVNVQAYGKSHLNNAVKNGGHAAIGIRQSFGGVAVKVEYLLLPNYLIRYYQDPEGSAYIPCAFDEQLWTIKAAYVANPRFELLASLGLERDDYVESFDFYDSRATRPGASLRLRLSRLLEPVVEYEFKDNDAAGPVPDISYAQHEIRFANTLRLPVPRGARMRFAYQWRHRRYTTDLSPAVDAPHSGRIDVTHGFALGMSAKIATGLSLGVDYLFEARSAASEAYDSIEQYKNYHRWDLSGGLRYDL